MELDLLVTNILPPISGQSARGAWTKQEVVFEIPSEFNRKICIGFMGERVQLVSSLSVGELVKVYFNVESREFNGKWYTNVNAWKIEKPAQAAVQSVPPAVPMPPLGGMPAESKPFAAGTDPLDENYTPADDSGDLPF